MTRTQKKQKRNLKQYRKDHSISANGRKIYLFSSTQQGFSAWIDEFYDASVNNRMTWKNEEESCFEVDQILYVNGSCITKNEYARLDSIAVKVIMGQI